MSTIVDSVSAFTQLIDHPVEHQKGPLKGYLFAVKDVFDVKGLRTQAGNPDYFEQAGVADLTAPAVSILQDAGAKLVGKTHTDELGGSLFGLNEHYGPPINSNSPDRVPGGSSSGSAAAVAANLIDFSLGGDTSGSVRAPASFCGIYGLRTTHGRIPITGVLPISDKLDTVGIFANSPDAISHVLAVYGIVQQRNFKRLRVIPSLLNHLNEELRNSFQSRLKKVESLFTSFAELNIDDDLLEKWRNVIVTIALYSIWQVHKDWVLASTPTLGELIRDRLNRGSSISYEDYQAALIDQENIKRYFNDNVRSDDVVVFPTLHDVAPVLSSSIEQLKLFSLNASRHTCLAALAGYPEISVPIKNIKDNCSLGLSLLAKAEADQDLVSLASKIGHLV